MDKFYSSWETEKHYNPWLGMSYDPQTKMIETTGKNLLCWLESWDMLSDTAKENCKKAIKYLDKSNRQDYNKNIKRGKENGIPV